MLHIPLRRFVLGLALSLLVASVCVFSSASYVSAKGFAFTNFELSKVTGTTCPNTSSTCTNGAAEPAIRADNAGNFYAYSENGLGAGTLAWKSSDGGKHYTTLVSPDAGSHTNSKGMLA